jgi:hypothetical protein
MYNSLPLLNIQGFFVRFSGLSGPVRPRRLFVAQLALFRDQLSVLNRETHYDF